MKCGGMYDILQPKFKYTSHHKTTKHVDNDEVSSCSRLDAGHNRVTDYLVVKGEVQDEASREEDLPPHKASP